MKNYFELYDFVGKYCSQCNALHGTPLAGGGKVILSWNGGKKMCHVCAGDFVKALRENPPHPKKRTGVRLEDYGVSQEVLL